MKQKCEEIIIDQYLKGNITDKEKTRHLRGVAMLTPKGVISIYNEMSHNTLQFFKNSAMFFEMWDQLSENNKEEVFSQITSKELPKILKEIEELENELPE